MAVLEHEQQRSPASGTGEEVGHRCVQAMALGVGVGDYGRRQPTDASVQVGK